MVDDKQKVRKQRVGREAYVPPKLRVFGPVGALTQSGTGRATESTMIMGAMDMQNRP
jgi:hypothetical protein